MPVPFLVSTVDDGNLAIISLEGAVDAHTAPQFESAVQAAIDNGKSRIIVDCEKLTYISSAGLGVFMSFVEEVREAGGDIKICGLTPKVKQPFEILGFDDLYDFCTDVLDAKNKFTESAAQGA
jgi:anti-sigma B factor antagonist